jgi:GT2 family glycosyltransferase
MTSQKVCVVILNWFNHEDTATCVRSVLKSDYSNFSITVVDNGSTNDSAEILTKEFPSIRIIASKENLGYAGGNKLAVDAALKEGAELIWVLNNDTTVRPDALRHLVYSFNQFGEAVYSNTTLMSENPDIIHYAGSYDSKEKSDPSNPYDRMKGRLLSELWNELQDKEARIYGHSLLIPASIIRKFGFMDTAYFMFCEEEDYFKRLRQYKVVTRYVRDAIIIHESSGSFKKSGQVDQRLKLPLLYYSKRNRYHLAMRWDGMPRTDILRSRGGWWPLVKFFVRYHLSSTTQQALMAEGYMDNLAAAHAFLGIRGRTLNPTNFR